MISKRYKKYKNFGKCLEISNGTVKALVTVDVGPRIIFYGFKGFNFMFEDTERQIFQEGEFFDRNYRPGEKWFIYGGHRLWKSPEDWASYTPDNYPVKVVRLENGAEFYSRTNEVTGLIAGMKVLMDEDGSLEITHSFKNVGEEPVRLSLWALSVLRPGGTEVIPMNCEDTGFLPNKNLVIWPYNDLKDKRFSLRERFSLLKQSKKADRPFKIGMNNLHGWAAYFAGGNLFVKKFPVEEGVYQDMHCNFETYTSNLMLESESLSAERTVLPGERTEYVENMYVFKDVQTDLSDESAIAATMKSLNLF